ncbi:MAG TPA: hypothetical protein GX525_10050 [Bacilli bacterium]|nr:hypothetical protein [Bacilli bacterium]
MKTRLERLETHKLKQIVLAKLDQLAVELDSFSKLDDALQTFEVKMIAQKMAHLYESVVAVEWATKHGGKFAKLAEIYLEDTYSLRQLGERMKTVEYFSDII